MRTLDTTQDLRSARWARAAGMALLLVVCGTDVSGCASDQSSTAFPPAVHFARIAITDLTVGLPKPGGRVWEGPGGSVPPEAAVPRCTQDASGSHLFQSPWYT